MGVAQQRDLGPMMDDLAVDVRHEGGHRSFRPGSLRRATWTGECLLAEVADPGDPGGVLLIELGQRTVCSGGVVPGHVVGGRATEVGVRAGTENSDDQVSDAPGDGGDRRGLGLGEREVDGHLPAADLHGSGPGAASSHAPATGHRLPEVLLVGQPLQPRAQLVLPVPGKLLEQPLVPTGHGLGACVHGSTLAVPWAAAAMTAARSAGRDHIGQ